MSKKDYILIAEAIKSEVAGWKEQGKGYENELGALKCLAYELTRRLQADNTRFDSSRFLEACGF